LIFSKIFSKKMNQTNLNSRVAIVASPPSPLKGNQCVQMATPLSTAGAITSISDGIYALTLDTDEGCSVCDRNRHMPGARAYLYQCPHVMCAQCAQRFSYDQCPVCSSRRFAPSLEGRPYAVGIIVSTHCRTARTGWNDMSTTTIREIKHRLHWSTNHPPHHFDLVDEATGRYLLAEDQTLAECIDGTNLRLEYRSRTSQNKKAII
jgi:hypothetical protein